MSAPTHRHAIRAAVDAFFTGWSQRDWRQAIPLVAPDAAFLSNQHPMGFGLEGFANSLSNDADHGPFFLRTSNHYVGGDNNTAVASAYAFGLIQRKSAQFLFGATVAMTLRHAEQGNWLITSVRLSVNWQKGDTSLVGHWRRPPSNEGWQLGDPPPVLLSETDSPWAVMPDSSLACTVPEAVAELYSKYSWAIDQGDFALLRDCYTEDAAGGFAPMGQLSGRHDIVGQLKNFRRHWPWMQHFADVLLVEHEEGEQHARLLVGRIIPERPVDEQGRRVYGAHYQLQARLEADGRWRICWSDYRPGWFGAADLPPFDIGRSDA